MILILLLGVFKIRNIILKKIFKLEYEEYVNKYSEENNIDPYLTFAIIGEVINVLIYIFLYPKMLGLM